MENRASADGYGKKIFVKSVGYKKILRMECEEILFEKIAALAPNGNLRTPQPTYRLLGEATTFLFAQNYKALALLPFTFATT